MMSHDPRQDVKTAVCGACVLCLLLLSPGILGQTASLEPGGDDGSPVTPLVTSDPAACPATDTCHTAAAVVGSLVAGFVLGIVVTYCVQLVLRRRQQRIPPKDYSVTESRHYDVNRNSDGSIHVTSAPSRVKGHKKLERLVKLSHTSPGDTETTPAVAPLIHRPTAEPGPTTDNPSTAAGASSQTAAQDVTYANIGTGSILSQPYDSLDIIPEESEYESFRSSAHEGTLVEVATK